MTDTQPIPWPAIEHAAPGLPPCPVNPPEPWPHRELSPVGFLLIVGALAKRMNEREGDQDVEIGTEDLPSERGELHFLAALVDELMKALLTSGIMSRSQLQDVENAVSAKLGSTPRAW